MEARGRREGWSGNEWVKRDRGCVFAKSKEALMKPVELLCIIFH